MTNKGVRSGGMRSTILSLLPLIIAAAVLPVGIMMTLFWLRDILGKGPDRFAAPRRTGQTAGSADVLLGFLGRSRLDR